MRAMLRLSVLLLAACAGGGSPAKEAINQAPSAATAETWTCPMHPEVVADKAGKCPKCGMDLIKKGG